MLVRALQESVEKSDDTKRGLATAGGALAGSAAYNTGYAGKWIGYHQRGKHKYTKAEGEQLNAHNKQYKGNKPGFFRNYPKNLPSAKLQRTLGRTHSGKSGMALASSNYWCRRSCWLRN